MAAHKPTLWSNDEVQRFTISLAAGIPSPRCPQHNNVLCCFALVSYTNDITGLLGRML